MSPPVTTAKRRKTCQRGYKRRSSSSLGSFFDYSPAALGYPRVASSFERPTSYRKWLQEMLKTSDRFQEEMQNHESIC